MSARQRPEPPNNRPIAGTSNRGMSARQRPEAPVNRRPAGTPARYRNMPSRMNSRGKKKHHGSKRLYYLMFTLIGVLVVVILANTVLFNLSSIETDSLYPQDTVIEASGLQPGMNLLYIDTEEAKQNILTALPDADEVDVRKVFPSKAIITITQATPAAVVAFDQGSYLVSEKGRIIEVDDKGYTEASLPAVTEDDTIASPSGLSFAQRIKQLKAMNDSALPQITAALTANGSDGAAQTPLLLITGFDPVDARLGDALQSNHPDKLDLLFRMIDAIRAAELTEAAVLDLTDPLDIKIRCGNVILEIGGVSDLSIKLSAAHKIMGENLQSGGTLDIRNATEGVFTPS
jgi:cell division septal protein FtsQ